MIVLERIKLKSRNPWVTRFFVRYRRTYVLDKLMSMKKLMIRNYHRPNMETFKSWQTLMEKKFILILNAPFLYEQWSILVQDFFHIKLMFFKLYSYLIAGHLKKIIKKSLIKIIDFEGFSLKYSRWLRSWTKIFFKNRI